MKTATRRVEPLAREKDASIFSLRAVLTRLKKTLFSGVSGRPSSSAICQADSHVK